MFAKIISEANRIQPELIEIRRHIHRNPELGFEEWETARLITEQLNNLGLQVTSGVAKTGVIGYLAGKGRHTVALRADMDALPVEEQNEVSYKSLRPGIMHACGHDAHVAMLIGAAKILAQYKDDLNVNVKFIFQPCEEQPSGGAEPMIKEGVLEKPKVDAVFGLHINPYIPSGCLGLKEGTVMAAADRFIIEIKGKGGHGAAPHQTVDPIFIACHVVQAIQSIVSRQTDPVEPLVISVCSIDGGQSFNVIPDRVTLDGTVRTVNTTVQQGMPEQIRNVVKGVTSAFGADFTLDYRWGYPALINNPHMVEVVRTAGYHILGRTNVLPVIMPSMGAEDFACFTARVPGAYFFLGAKPDGTEPHPWHNSRFDLNEASLAKGAALFAGCAIQAGKALGKEEI